MTPEMSPQKMAVLATLHCLTGCAIGEVLGMVVSTAAGLGTWPSVLLSILLAFGFGYGLSMRSLLQSSMSIRKAFSIALAADTVSISSMEIVDNLVILAVPNAINAGLGTWLFWASLAGSLVVAFVVTVPVNRWLIVRGRGHAVMHGHH